MAEIVMQNPGSSEIQSPLIAGLSEGLSKISKVLNLTTRELVDEPLKAVEIDSADENKNRIYEVIFRKKLWLSSPTPVIKINGVEVEQTKTPYTIDFIGGSVTFKKNRSSSDKVTVTARYIDESSTTINTITNLLSETSEKADKYKGYFDTVETLNSKIPTGKSGDIAFVEKPQFAIFAWDSVGRKWKNTQSIEDLQNYYDKNAVDEKLNKKENSITATGKATDYLAGDKKFKDLNSAVRETKLTGIETSSDADVLASDSVLSAAGKLQVRTKKALEKAYLTGTGEPTTSTKGSVGQRYVNTSNGDFYICKENLLNSYKWKKIAEYNQTKVFSCNLTTSEWKEKNGKFEKTEKCTGMKKEYNCVPIWFYKVGNEELDLKSKKTVDLLNDGVMETLDESIKFTVSEIPKYGVKIYTRRSFE